jgi:hypothetical protein
MKQHKTAIILALLALSISSGFRLGYCANISQEPETVPLSLALRFRDYNSGIAVANISVSVRVSTDLGMIRLDAVCTNETGMIQSFIDDIEPETTVALKTLQYVMLSDNYTLVKVQNIFVDDPGISTSNYNAMFSANQTMHSGLRIDLAYNTYENYSLIEGVIWVLKGKAVQILDFDPVSGERASLITRPAIRIDDPRLTTDYGSYYLFPLNYEVTIFDRNIGWEYIDTRVLDYGAPYSPLRVKIDENTTYVNWVSHAASDYVGRRIYHMDQEMSLLESARYPLDRENEEYNAIKSLMNRVLDLYDKGEYVSALGGANIIDKKLTDLTKWLSDIKFLAVLTTVGISLFAYGLGMLLSSFLFDEPSENKIRLGIKVLTFSLMMVVFSISHPSLKISFAMLIGSRNISLSLSLLGCLVIGSITYFTIQLISARKKTMTDLAMQLGVRSLKRRRSRTILTLLTITIIVSSAIVFVNISMNRETRIRGQWTGTNISGVIVKPNTFQAPVSEYDVNWTRLQEWCSELTYVESINELEHAPEADIRRIGFLAADGESSNVEILAIDPAYMEKHYQMSERVTGFWTRFLEGEQVAIIPTSFGIMTNEPINLGATETRVGMIGSVQIPYGEFKVVATYDPQTAFSDLVKIDGSPLFEDTANLVLVPIKSIRSNTITISEITVLTKPGFEPLDVAQELAYTLAAETVANGDGVSRRIVWSTEFSITGLIPYLPPLIIAGLMMYTTMVSVYEERKKEFTTLATLGLDPRNAFQVFLVEALLLGSMGTFIGFFGSYILGAGLFYLASFLNTPGLSVLALPFAHWSMPAILVALLAGVFMVFLGGYIPAVRTRGISLMGREQRREMVGELISSEGVTSLTLPIRETVRNGEMLFSYIRETIGKFKTSLVDSHSVKGELYRDGTFRVSFVAMADMYRVTVPCEIKGVREGDILIPVIEFPTSFKSYERIRLIIRDLEQYMIGFSAWKEMQLKMTIVREAPRKQKTIQEIMTDIKDVMNQVKDCGKKLKILDGQKAKLSEEVFNEFREKYIKMIDEKSKSLRTMTINLEPHHKELHEEIDKIEVEVERITIAYNLGEITEEEYIKTCGPLQARLAELRGRVTEMEEIFDFLKKPLGVEYT